MSDEKKTKRTLKIGGISFNKIVVGRKRTVEFKIANPTQDDLVVSSIYIKLIQDTNAMNGSLDSIINSNSPSSSKNENRIFEIVKMPKLPLTLLKNTEISCGVSFSPLRSGWFNAILYVVPSSFHPVQQITLHGEGEFPTSPQQLVISSNSVSKSTSGKQILEESTQPVGVSYVVNSSNFAAKDEDIELSKASFSQSSFAFSTKSVQHTPVINKTDANTLKDSWVDRFPIFEDKSTNVSNSETPKGSGIIYPSTSEIGMDIILQLQKRIQSLEEKFETLSISLTKERSSNRTLSPSPPLTPFHNNDDDIIDNVEESELPPLSASSASFLRELGTPLTPKEHQNNAWKNFVKAKSPHSPGFANFTTNLAKRYETTPQINAMYKTPIWQEELALDNDSIDYSSTPFGKRPK